jgi:KaiC domain protein
VSENDEDDEDWFERALREDDAAAESDDADDPEENPDSFGEETGKSPGTPGDQGSDERSDPFGDQGPGASADPFAEQGSGEGTDPFGEDPADAGGGDIFEEGFASAFGATGDDLEESDYGSDIPRLSLGIEGLDAMIQGGIPERHLVVTIGAPGTGKTTFGLQFLHHGLAQGDSCVFITLEQSRETILETANERGWEFDRYEAEDTLAVVDLDPVEMAASLDNIRGELPELVQGFDADRLVLDSVSLLEMMYDDQARRRTEVFDFTRSLKNAGVTTFLTSEASESNPYASRHGIIEYLTDAVFVLQYVRGETQETRLAVEIQKIRNANHSREKKPYEITMDGISVYRQASIF